MINNNYPVYFKLGSIWQHKSCEEFKGTIIFIKDDCVNYSYSLLNLNLVGTLPINEFLSKFILLPIK